MRRLTEDFALFGVLGDEVEHVFGFHDLVQADDVVVLQHLQDLHFAVKFAQIGRIQLALVHDFDRHLRPIDGSQQHRPVENHRTRSKRAEHTNKQRKNPLPQDQYRPHLQQQQRPSFNMFRVKPGRKGDVNVA